MSPPRRLGTPIAAALLLAIGAVAGAAALDQGSGARTGNDSIAAEQARAAHHKRARRGPQGPRGRRGKRGPRGAAGPRGPAGFNNERLLALGVHWRDSREAPGFTADSANAPGLGAITIRCPADNDFDRSKRLLRVTPVPSNRRTVVTVTTFEGAGTTRDHADNERFQSTDGSPIEIELPPNGMIDGVIALEPFAGGSTAAGSLRSGVLTLSSEWKTNDADEAENFCHVSAQIVVKGAP